jgi:hypothetical protein
MKKLKRVIQQSSTFSFMSKNKIFLLIIFSLLFEFLNKYPINFQLLQLSLSFIFKSIIVFVAAIIIVKERNKLLLYPLFILIGYLVLELAINPSNAGMVFFTYGLRYLYYIFLLGLLFKFNDLKLKHFLKFFDIFMAFNTILIISGMLFDIGVFHTYRGLRFGFNGFLNMPSDTNYIYILYALLGYFFYEERSYAFKNVLFFNLLLSLATGTKTVIFVSLIVLANIYFRKPNKIMSSVYLLLIFTGAIFSKKIYQIIEPTKNMFVSIYNEQGFLSAISSFRFYNLKQTLNIFATDVIWYEFFIYNSDFIDIRVEMELFDLLFFWGLLGAILYVYFFIQINNKILVLRKDVYIILILILASSLGGKFLTNFIAILLTYTYLTSKRSHNVL